MSTQNQVAVPPNLSTVPVKRKRGRPRKNNQTPQSSVSKKPPFDNPFRPVPTPINPSLNPNPNPNPNPSSSSSSLLGKAVCGTLDGTFDSGYLITVRVSETGTVLKGMVFDPSISVPVSKENDVAPLLPMVKRNNVTPGPNVFVPVKMVQPLQMRKPGASMTHHTDHTEKPKEFAEEIVSSSGFSEQSDQKVNELDQNVASKPGENKEQAVSEVEQFDLKFEI